MGKTVKMLETLKALTTKHFLKERCGRGNDLGYGNNVKDEKVTKTSKWIISSQVLRTFTTVKVTDAVQRADVSRSTNSRPKVCSSIY